MLEDINTSAGACASDSFCMETRAGDAVESGKQRSMCRTYLIFYMTALQCFINIKITAELGGIYSLQAKNLSAASYENNHKNYSGYIKKARSHPKGSTGRC